MVDENASNGGVSLDGGRRGGAQVVRSAGDPRGGETRRRGAVEGIDFGRRGRRMTKKKAFW